MTTPLGRPLLLSATEFEVAPLLAGAEAARLDEPFPSNWPLRSASVEGVLLWALATGIGKANAAAATALAIRALRPSALLLVGIGGAYPGAGLERGGVALAASETHLDSGVGHGAVWRGLDSIGFPLLPGEPPRFNRLDLSRGANGELIARLARELGVAALPFGTAEAVTADGEQARLLRSRHGVAIESMEGAAVAQVALAFGVPLAQLRGVSNLVGDRDKGNWRVAAAVASSCTAARTALPHLAPTIQETS